jgi:hypothetical protein
MSQPEGDAGVQSLHRIATLLQQHTGETSALLEEVVGILPDVLPGMPGIAARIQYGELNGQGPGWCESGSAFAVPCGTRDGTDGRIEVIRLDPPDRASFTVEQQRFLMAVGAAAGRAQPPGRNCIRRRAEEMSTWPAPPRDSPRGSGSFEPTRYRCPIRTAG